jgi:hypothetical protein
LAISASSPTSGSRARSGASPPHASAGCAGARP